MRRFFSNKNVKTAHHTPYLALPRFNVPQFAQNGIFIMLLCYAFYIMRDFFMPLTLSIILNFLLAPISRFLQRRLNVSRFVSATLIVTCLLGSVCYSGYVLSTPMLKWLGDLPSVIDRVEDKIQKIRKPVESFSRAAESVRQFGNGSRSSQPELNIVRDGKSLAQILFTGTQSFFVYMTVMSGILFFMLTYGHVLFQSFLKTLSHPEDREATFIIACDVEKKIFSYLFTVTAINVVLGIATSVVLYFQRIPNPILWGVLTAAMNYVPYLGALVGQIIILLVSVATFDSLNSIFWVNLTYFMMTSVIEANFITPFVLGKRFVFNPLVLVVWLFFWGWLWGILGTLLAVPLLVIVKSICERIKALKPLTEILEST